MSAAWFLSWLTAGEVITIVLLIAVIIGQFRIRRGIRRLEDSN